MTPHISLPYEVVCWTPQSAEAVSSYRGKPYTKLDPANHRSHHHLKTTAVKVCKQQVRALGLGARGEVYTIEAATGTRAVVYGCRAIYNEQGKLKLIEEDIT